MNKLQILLILLIVFNSIEAIGANNSDKNNNGTKILNILKNIGITASINRFQYEIPVGEKPELVRMVSYYIVNINDKKLNIGIENGVIVDVYGELPYQQKTHVENYEDAERISKEWLKVFGVTNEKLDYSIGRIRNEDGYNWRVHYNFINTDGYLNGKSYSIVLQGKTGNILSFHTTSSYPDIDIKTSVTQEQAISIAFKEIQSTNDWDYYEKGFDLRLFSIKKALCLESPDNMNIVPRWIIHIVGYSFMKTHKDKAYKYSKDYQKPVVLVWTLLVDMNSDNVICYEPDKFNRLYENGKLYTSEALFGIK